MKELTLGHIISRLLKTSDKEKTLKAARRKKKTEYIQNNKISMAADFLSEIKQLRQQWSNTFTNKTKCYQPRILF